MGLDFEPSLDVGVYGFRGLQQLGILFGGVGSVAWISHPALVILGFP
jgi:hypothetical protein